MKKILYLSIILFSISLSYGQNKKIPTEAKNELELADKYYETIFTQSIEFIEISFNVYNKYIEYLTPLQLYRLANLYREKAREASPKDDSKDGKSYCNSTAIFYYEKAAAAGNPEAMLLLGYNYYTGSSVGYNLSTLAYEYNKNLASTDNQFIDVDRDTEKANKYFEKYAKIKGAKGMFDIAETISRTQGIIKFLDRENAVDESILWYEKAANAGNEEAMKQLAKFYYYKITEEQKAIYWYEKLANKGDTEAMMKLVHYYKGTTPAKMFFWLEKAANKGNVEAFEELGYIYSQDKSTVNKAIYWYEKAIAAKSKSASYSLAELYYKGEVVPKNYLKAKDYYEDHIQGEYVYDGVFDKLGFIYSTLHSDTLVPKDNQKAIKYLERAYSADYREKIAQIYYYGGAGVTQDKKKAEKYFDNFVFKKDENILKVIKFYEANNETPIKWYKLAVKICNDHLKKNSEDQETVKYLQENEKKIKNYYNNLLAQTQKAIEQDDYTKAIKIYEEAITNGDDEAKMLLADLYYEGKLGVPNYTRAFELYKEPAEGYEDIAALRKAEMLYNGKGVNKNQSLAFRHYTEAANLGNTEAMLFLAQAYYNGTAVTKNDAEALKWYQKAANKGDLKAKAAYGKMLYYGIGTNPDKSTAATYLEQAAQAGDTEAMALYGLLCEDLLKTDQAKEWYQKAAEAQHPVALRQLGKLYATGRAVTKDDKKALELYQQAATANDAEAMNLLAGMYLEGICTPKNPTEAFNWYQKAAKADMPAAMYSLANLYKKGKGVKKDKDKAYFWMQRACNLGYLSACDDKAVKKENGTSSLDTPKDIHKTYEYLSYNGYATPSKWQFVIAYSPLKILSKDFNHRLDTGFVKKKSNNLYFALNNEFGRFRFGFSTASSELEVPEEGYNEPLKGRIGYNNFVISWKYVPPILNDRLVLYPGISIVNNGYTLKRGKEEIFKDGTISLFYSAETNFYIIKYMSIVAGFARSIAASSKYAMQYFYIGIAINTGPFDNDNEI